MPDSCRFGAPHHFCVVFASTVPLKDPFRPLRLQSTDRVTFMKIKTCFFTASICSAVSIASTFAGGHQHVSGVASSASTTNTVAVGRSPLGEPVFLYQVPATAAVTTPVKQTPKNSIHANVSSRLEKRMAHLQEKEIGQESGRKSKVIFTPPPTIDNSQTPQPATPNNPAGNNRAIDHPFTTNILTTGLDSKGSKPTPDAPQIQTATSYRASSISPLGGGDPSGPPTLDRVSAPVTQTQVTSVTVQVSSSAPNTISAGTATGR